jgi:hypothetical protein
MTRFNARPHLSDLSAATAWGVAANFPWEMAHSFLYRGAESWGWKRHFLCCGLASLTDGIGIALIFGIGVVVLNERRWTRCSSLIRLGATGFVGLIGAVAVEQLALRLGWWSYKPAMPRIFGTELALSPLVQLTLIPLVVLFLVLPRQWRHIT